MSTKTQEIFSEMDYFLTLKESGGQNSSTYEDSILPKLSVIYANQVKKGLHSEEEIESFREMLPGTSEMFDQPYLHGSCASLKSQFDKIIQVNLAEYRVDQAENEMSLGKSI